MSYIEQRHSLAYDVKLLYFHAWFEMQPHLVWISEKKKNLLEKMGRFWHWFRLNKIFWKISKYFFPGLSDTFVKYNKRLFGTWIFLFMCDKTLSFFSFFKHNKEKANETRFVHSQLSCVHQLTRKLKQIHKKRKNTN